MGEKDPIGELNDDLHERGQPSLAWMVRWGGGGDPVQAAWGASRSSGEMIRLLEFADRPYSAMRARDAAKEYRRSYPSVPGPYAWQVAAAVRRAVPEAPSLAACTAGRIEAACG